MHGIIVEGNAPGVIGISHSGIIVLGVDPELILVPENNLVAGITCKVGGKVIRDRVPIGREGY
jgi:hypothetical protein